MSTRNLRLLAPIVTAALAVAVACGNDRIKRNNEPIEVVTGQPGVVQILPGVLRTNPDGGLVIGGAAPYQVDSFVQPKVSKVDILWVIDDSPSMSPKQDRVKQNFTNFIQFLNDQQIDYHLGVTTTDTYDPNRSGKLQNSAGLAKPWIDLEDTAADGGTAAVAFVTNATVGITGSGDEKGLLGGMLALTTPRETTDGGNCTGDGGCFLRPEAQLYTIIVSDEEDSSCAPVRGGGLGNSEGCDDAQAALNGYGDIAYWSRFYSGIKGPAGVSRLAVITGTDSTFQQCSTIFAGFCDSYIGNSCPRAPDCTQFGNLGNPCCQGLSSCSKVVSDKAQWCEVHQANADAGTGPFYRVTGVTYTDPNSHVVTDLGGFPGCVAYAGDGGPGNPVDFTAYYAPRYASVAVATGGVATSICKQNYTPALETLGLQASGLRTDFPLSRTPVDGTLVVTVNGAQVATSATTWQYVKCNGTSPINSIHFGCTNNDSTCSKAALPPPNAAVSASYDVNVRGLGTCP